MFIYEIILESLLFSVLITSCTHTIRAILTGKTGQQMICFLHIKELTHGRVTKRARYSAIEGHLTERFHTIIRER